MILVSRAMGQKSHILFAVGAIAIITIQPAQADSDISRIQDIIHPQQSAALLAQDPGVTVVQVTGVKANPTDKGVEVILQTTLGQQLQVVNRSAGNSFIVDIPNAQLRNKSGDAFTFRSQKPVEGITQITATNLDANTIRVTVTGEAGLPIVELFDSPDEGLIFGVASVVSTPQQPQTSQTPEQEQPTSETQPEQEASAEDDEPIELVVTGEQDGYSVRDSSTATKIDTPLRDIPQSIQVIPQQVIRDQNITQLQDAIRNVPGVNVFTPPSFPTANVSIRGFLVGAFSGNYLRDGLREPSQTTFDFSNIERVEVLKGPASVLFGRGLPGGTVNLITKQPLSDPFYTVDATIGSYDFYRSAVDLSGPLNDSGSVLYRLNAAYKNAGSFVDFLENEYLLVAPVVSLAIGEKTKLTLEGEYIDSTTNSTNLGIPADGTVLPNQNGKIPRNRNVNEPSAFNELTLGRVGYRFEHQFSDNWSLQNAFRAVFERNEQELYLPTSLASNNRIVNRLAIKDRRLESDSYDLSVDLAGKFSTGSIEHQLLIGTTLSFDRTTDQSFRGTAAPLDLFNPVYNSTVGSLSRASDATKTDSLGIYIQDQIKLVENLKVLLGVRFDTFKQTTENLVANTELEQSDNAFSPRFGIVYQPITPISLYASYTRSFSPVTGIAFGDNSFQPERGTQYEVGVKADLNNQLSATLAFYDIIRSNVTTADNRPGVPPGFSIQTGEQRSRGIELSLAGEILPGWGIFAGYAYNDARITKDNTFAVDNRVNNAPEHTFNLWTTYEIQQGSLQGFGVGAGFFFVGDRQGDLGNTFTVPSYFRTDAALFYRRDRFRAQINFRNIFDVDYFESAANRARLFAGEPFTVQGTISWEF